MSRLSTLLPAICLCATTAVAQQTTVALTSSANPAVFGQPVTLTATLSPVNATGSVTFYDGSAVLGIKALSGGTATLTTSLLAAGTRLLRAYYGGAGALTASTSTALAQTVTTTTAGGFLPTVISPSSAAAGALVIADFNNDGKADAAVANANGFSVLLGNGDGTFKAPVPASFTQATRLVAGDFNGDGKADIATINGGGTISVLLGNGDGTFKAPTSNQVVATFQTLVAGDFNSDGKVDLAAADFVSGSVTILLGKGDGTFTTNAATNPANLNVGVQSTVLSVGDFNGDGKPDLAMVGFSAPQVGVVRLLIGNGDGTFTLSATSNSTGGNVPSQVTTADLNGDGKLDIVTTSSTGINVLLGNGDGTFQTPKTFAGGDGTSVAIGDMNGDGRLDLVLSTANGSMVVMFGNGDGTFQAATGYASGSAQGGIGAVADFNGDGKADMIASLASGVGVFLGSTVNAPHLQFITISPGNVVQGVVMPTVVVQILDSSFRVVTGANNQITLTSNPAATSLTVAAVNGVATFNGLAINTVGMYTLTASSPGFVSVTSSPFIVVTNLPTLVVDNPAPGSTAPAGPTVISGWAMDNIYMIGTPIASVKVSVDGGPAVNATYGTLRQDVCTIYGNRPGCPNVGFTVTLNLPPGAHNITVTATDSDAVPDSVAANITMTSTGLMQGTKVGVFRNNTAFLEDNPGKDAYDPALDRFITTFAGTGGFVAGDMPVVGDWTGDGHAKVGIYRSTTGQWFLDANGNGILDANDFTYSFGGLPGDTPFVGDWTGLGKSCIGLYRTGSVWLLDLNCNGVFENTPTDAFFPFGGVPGDVPVVGSWTGGATKVGVVRKYAPGGVPQGNPFFWVTDGGAANGGNLPANHPAAANPFAFGGLPGDVFVTGDWYGTGVSYAGVYRNGLWVLDAGAPGVPQANHVPGLAFGFGGIAGDVPLTAKW